MIKSRVKPKLRPGYVVVDNEYNVIKTCWSGGRPGQQDFGKGTKVFYFDTQNGEHSWLMAKLTQARESYEKCYHEYPDTSEEIPTMSIGKFTCLYIGFSFLGVIALELLLWCLL